MKAFAGVRVRANLCLNSSKWNDNEATDTSKGPRIESEGGGGGRERAWKERKYKTEIFGVLCRKKINQAWFFIPIPREREQKTDTEKRQTKISERTRKARRKSSRQSKGLLTWRREAFKRDACSLQSHVAYIHLHNEMPWHPLWVKSGLFIVWIQIMIGVLQTTTFWWKIFFCVL